MSKVEMNLLDVPYEVLFELFRGLSKDKLIKISKLCSKFKDVAGDTRLWKNAHIRYVAKNCPKYYAFEELYSEPWPVKEIDLSFTRIKPPVSPQTDQIIKVRNLDLTSITADKVTVEAILAKYQCTELYLDYNKLDREGCVMGIDSEAFSKQTALEVLSLRWNKSSITVNGETMLVSMCHEWLAPILRNCKKLKILDLTGAALKHSDMLVIAECLPASLEKLLLVRTVSKNAFFKLLFKSAPNLRELELSPSVVKCPTLLKFQYLETFHIVTNSDSNISILYKYLIKFPALKIAHIYYYGTNISKETDIKNLRAKLIPYDIDVELIKKSQEKAPYRTDPKYGDLWLCDCVY